MPDARRMSKPERLTAKALLSILATRLSTTTSVCRRKRKRARARIREREREKERERERALATDGGEKRKAGCWIDEPSRPLQQFLGRQEGRQQAPRGGGTERERKRERVRERERKREREREGARWSEPRRCSALVGRRGVGEWSWFVRRPIDVRRRLS
jgi:hypothetical protein